ncbi:hypothetical protein BLOT_014205 [Blomia tropicalis]|nr:hypothetical protein BLOT_014205 [Blomia tropicalis]
MKLGPMKRLNHLKRVDHHQLRFLVPSINRLFLLCLLMAELNNNNNFYENGSSSKQEQRSMSMFANAMNDDCQEYEIRKPPRFGKRATLLERYWNINKCANQRKRVIQYDESYDPSDEFEQTLMIDNNRDHFIRDLIRRLDIGNHQAQKYTRLIHLALMNDPSMERIVFNRNEMDSSKRTMLQSDKHWNENIEKKLEKKDKGEEVEDSTNINVMGEVAQTQYPSNTK